MLAGRTVIGTGAARDVGRAVAIACAKVEARLMLCAVHQASRLFVVDAQIVNLASDTAPWVWERLLAYVTSKGAVTRSVARELGTRHIGVTAVASGIMRNEATEYVQATVTDAVRPVAPLIHQPHRR